MISNDDFVFEDINYENLLYEVTMRQIKIELILLMKQAINVNLEVALNFFDE